MTFKILKAVTHPNVAKKQHLVPRVYMKKWSYNEKDSIWIIDKYNLDKGIQSKNINNINFKTGFHDIKAGDVFVPDEALEDLFGFMKEYSVTCEGITLKTLRDLKNNYFNYDKWIITDYEGNIATDHIKNEFKRVIEQSRYSFIETEWCYQYENGWNDYIETLEFKVRCNVFATLYNLPKDDRKQLMGYILIYDFRNIHGNLLLNNLIDKCLPKEIADMEISKEYKTHSFFNTVEDEIKHGARIKAYYEYLKNKNGNIALMIDKYLESFGIIIYLTTKSFPFVTSEAPSMVITKENGFIEHIFVATPTMLISTFKTDKKEHYIRKYLSHKEVNKYNKYIAKHADFIITSKSDLNIKELYQ